MIRTLIQWFRDWIQWEPKPDNWPRWLSVKAVNEGWLRGPFDGERS